MSSSVSWASAEARDPLAWAGTGLRWRHTAKGGSTMEGGRPTRAMTGGADTSSGDRGARHQGGRDQSSADAGVGEDADAALLARFASGDQSAARALTERLLPGLVRQAWRMLGDPGDAEDVAQEAMLRLWRQAPDWRAGEAKVSTWLYRVAHNLCIDRIRKRRPGPAIEDIAEPVDPSPSALARIAGNERAQMLVAAIAALPERQGQAIRLRHFEGLGNPEIGERLDCSVEAVESLLGRARRALSAAMAAVEGGEDE